MDTGTTTKSDNDFSRLADPYRRELLAHCYRMLGSVHDAEDLVQETMLRAWRAYDKFEERSSLRTWLYRIATRTCLTALETRSRRPLPTGLVGPSDDPAGELAENHEVPWLEPIPTGFAEDNPADPASIVAARETTRLALVAALQHLPPRQRAVLLLREVLKWKAAEVAELLDTTTAAVNSSLQRARAQLEEVSPEAERLTEPDNPANKELLERYVKAFESYDIPAIVGLFTSDAVWEMPPFLTWVRGALNIGKLIEQNCPAKGPGDMRMLPVSANGQPALALYMRDPDGVHRAFNLQVLSLTAAGVAHTVAFFDLSLFETFNLPTVLASVGDLPPEEPTRPVQRERT